MQRFLIALLLAARAWGALSASVVWEVRPTVGADTSGGNFDSSVTSPGTDYSQQNSPHVTFNGSTITATTVGVTATIVITGYTVLATDNGNGLQITGGTGFLTGFYTITSVNTGANTWTLDRNATSGAATGMTGAMGGALATVSKANTAATAANVVWIKATGTYTVTTALVTTLNSSSLPGNPYSFIGYTTTRGDNGKVTWTTATNSVDLVDMNAAYNVQFQNITFTNTAGTPGSGLVALATGNTTSVYVINCSFSGFASGISGNWNVTFAFNQLYFINSRVTTSTAQGIINSGNTFIFGSMIDNNTGDGAQWSSGNSGAEWWTIANSVFYHNGVNGFDLLYTANANLTGVTISNSDFSSNTMAGITFGQNALSPASSIQNSIFDVNGTYGVDGHSGTTTNLPWLTYNNAFYNNTTAATRNLAAGIGTITLSASPYTTLGSNFGLNNTSGGGAALKAAGFPGTIPGAGTGFMSVGALQPSSAVGGQKGFPIVQ